MKRLIFLLATTIATAAGCTFSRDGSQAITFNPLNIGSKEPVLAPAHDNCFTNGEPMDIRR